MSLSNEVGFLGFEVANRTPKWLSCLNIWSVVIAEVHWKYVRDWFLVYSIPLPILSCWLTSWSLHMKGATLAWQKGWHPPLWGWLLGTCFQWRISWCDLLLSSLNPPVSSKAHWLLEHLTAKGRLRTAGLWSPIPCSSPTCPGRQVHFGIQVW